MKQQQQPYRTVLSAQTGKYSGRFTPYITQYCFSSPIFLFETCYLSLFSVDFFQNPWLREVEISCAQHGGDWLLIEEWRQLGAFSLPANHGVMTPFLWRFKRGGERHPGGSCAHSESVHDPLRTAFPLDCQLETLACVVLLGHLGCPHFSSEEWKLCLFGNPLKSKLLYTFSLTFYFPEGCRRSFVCYTQMRHVFFVSIFTLGWPVSNFQPVPPQL